MDDLEDDILTLTAHSGSIRLDKFLAESGAGLSRARFQALIAQGCVTAGGRTVVDPSYKVKPGETVSAVLPEPEETGIRAEPMPLSIVHEDASLIVIDKPAGLVVHPAPGNWSGTLVNGLLAHCGASLSGIGGVRRPGIVHRLDKETSGLLVVAKTDAAHRALSAQFAAHGRDGRLRRAYTALVWGMPERRRGSIDTRIGRSPSNRLKMAVLAAGGRQALTHYVVEEDIWRDGRALASRVTCELETGRTHQIRVHMAHIGHPVIGDNVYAAGFASSANRLPPAARHCLETLARQALHASVLGFEHPETGENLCFELPLPADLDALLQALRDSADGTGPAAASSR